MRPPCNVRSTRGCQSGTKVGPGRVGKRANSWALRDLAMLARSPGERRAKVGFCPGSYFAIIRPLARPSSPALLSLSRNPHPLMTSTVRNHCCLFAALLLGSLLGCGTTRWSDSARTATEQLLLSDALDRAVSRLDFRAMAGRTVFLETSPLKGIVDSEYLISSVRQHALASGCILRTKAEEADYVLEIRAGAVGTDRHDLLFGIPATTLPGSTLIGTGTTTQVPEIPFIKRTDQQAVAKIAVFAYNRQTGRPVWQSGIVPVESSAKALWVLGSGPFRRGKIYDGTRFAGDKLSIPMIKPGQGDTRADLGEVSVTAEAYFAEPEASAAMARHDPLRTAGSVAPPQKSPPRQSGPWPAAPVDPRPPESSVRRLPEGAVPSPYTAPEGGRYSAP